MAKITPVHLREVILGDKLKFIKKIANSLVGHWNESRKKKPYLFLWVARVCVWGGGGAVERVVPGEKLPT